MPTYLTKSRGRYLFAIGIPERHRAAVRATWPNALVGATTIRKSLGTTDPREAMRRAAPLIALWLERLAGLENDPTAWARARSDLATTEAEWEVASAKLAAMALPMPLGQPTPMAARMTFNGRAKRIMRRFAVAKENLLKSIPPGVVIDADAALGPLRAELTAEVDELAKLLEPYGGPMVAPSGPTFRQAVARWKLDRSPAVGSVKQVDGVAKRWDAYFGGKSVADVSKKDVLAWRQSMQAAGDVSPQRINVIVGFAGAVLSAAEEAGMIETNPVHKLRALVATGTGRDSFTVGEVASLLKHSDLMNDQAAAWIIRLAAYSGARLNEVAQLTADDVVDDGEILAIDINGKGGKTIKNKASWRVVPVHPDIADRLREFVKGKKGRIFWPEGDASAALGKEITAAGIRRAGTCFHSLRHSFKDRCREAGIGEEIHDALTGHAGGSVGRRYGGRPPLSVLAEAVAKLRFPLILLNK